MNPTDGTNTPGIFQTSTSFEDRLGIQNNLILSNNEVVYIYQHMFNKPLQAATLFELNHFCALQRRVRRYGDFIIPVNEKNKADVVIVNYGYNQNFISNIK